MDVIYGIHAVSEVVQSRPQRLEYVAVARAAQDARLRKLLESCRAAKVTVRSLAREELTRLAGNGGHQGVIAVASSRAYAGLEDILARQRGAHRFIVVLDGVEDPHNLGAVIRTADGAGADGILIPENRAAGITAVVAKVSAGASEHLPVARITNVARTVEELKRRNVWTVGLDERGSQTYDQLDYNMDCALVLGAEGHGLHQLVRDRCDFLVSIPMLGKVPSLNVSVAAAVVMYEVARQRRMALAAQNDGSPKPRRRTGGDDR